MPTKKEIRDARRKAGLCTQCGEPASGKARCSKCSEKAATARRERYQTQADSGICGSCNSRKARPGKRTCQECSDKAGVASTTRYHQNKEAGVCCYCGADSGGRSRCDDCAADFADYSQEWYAQRKAEGKCPNCGGNLEDGATTVLCETCRGKKNEVARQRWLRLKIAAFNAYGGPTCVECSEDDVTILEIDHIDGGGTAHRREIGLSNIYLWLQQQNYPTGFRVLCPTCNKKAHVKSKNGG